MTSPIQVKALQNHYKKVYIEQGHPNFWMVLDPDDIATWYVLLHDMGEDNLGGEYLMRMTAPANYPYSPPLFEFFTPNPRYAIGGMRPCVSMGEYHADNYPALLGMYGFTCELIYSFFASDKDMGGGISMIMGTSKESKLKMARESVGYNNKHYPELMKLFDEERKRVFKNPLKPISVIEEIKSAKTESPESTEPESQESQEADESQESQESEESEEVKVSKSKKTEKPIKSEKPTKLEKTTKSDKAPKSEKPKKSSKSEKAPKSDKTIKIKPVKDKLKY